MVKGPVMVKQAERKQKARIRNYMGMTAISMIALLLLGVIFAQAQTLEKRLEVYDSKLSVLEKQLEEEYQRTEEIEETAEYMKTDEYVESVAREKLGLVKENEIVFREAE